MKPDVRIKLAGEKLERILGALSTLMQLRENNDVVLRSDVLSKQVGTSYAANAFNVFLGAVPPLGLCRLSLRRSQSNCLIHRRHRSVLH